MTSVESSEASEYIPRLKVTEAKFSCELKESQARSESSTLPNQGHSVPPPMITISSAAVSCKDEKVVRANARRSCSGVSAVRSVGEQTYCHWQWRCSAELAKGDSLNNGGIGR